MRSIVSALCLIASIATTVSAQNLLTGPNNLNFTATVNGAAPAAQTFAVRHTGDPAPRSFTLTTSTLNGGPWLGVSNFGGTTPARITVTANPQGLPAGPYSGTILVAAAGSATTRIDVSLNVTASSQLTVSPASLGFARQAGVEAPIGADDQLLIVNTTGAAANYGVTATTNDNGAWLSTTATPGTPGVVTVRANSTGLPAGTYTGSLAISAQGLTTVNVPVQLIVGANPVLTVNPPSLTIAASRIGAAVTNTVAVATSSGTVSFSATASTATGGNWLIATPLIGSAPGSVDISANPAGLTAGVTYTGAVQIAAAAAANPSIVIPVSFTVSDAPIIATSTRSSAVSISADAPQANLIRELQPFIITASAAGTAISTVVTTQNGGAWLTAAAPTGVAPGNVLAVVDATGLSAGTYRGQVTVSGPGNQINVAVVLTVTAATAQAVLDPASVTFNLQKGQTPPSNQIVNIASTGAAYVFQSSITSITPANATWLTGAVSTGTTPASLTLGINSVAAAALPNGQYSANVSFVPQSGFSPAPATTPTLVVVLNVSDTALFNISPAFVDITVPFNGNPPASRTISVTATDNSPRPFTATVSTTSGGNWLLAGPTSGATPQNINLQALPFGLAVGVYEGSIQVVVPSISATPQAVRVRLIVQPTATLAADPAILAFSQAAGGAPPAARTIAISGTTSANFRVTVSTASGGSWLGVSPTGGSTPGSLTVSANGAALPAGVYNGSIGLTSGDVNNSPLVIPVTLTVAAPTLSVTPALVSLSTTPGSSAPITQTLALTAGAAAYTAVAATTTGGNWLTVSPTSGIAPATLTVTANPSQLPAGTFSGSITVTTPGLTGSPLVIPVTFTVVAVAPPGLQVISQIADGAGWKTTITLVNLDVEPAPFTLRFFGNDGAVLRLPFEGSPGRLEVLEGIIPVGGLSTILTAGTDTLLSEGWAELTSTKQVGGLGVFRQRGPGRADQEAAVSAIVPTSRFVLPFDNAQGFTSSMALANTNATSARATTASPRNVDGSLLAGNSVNLPARGHIAFSMPERFPSIVARRGSAEFTSTGPDFAALGLRFNDTGAFTSLPSLPVPSTTPAVEISQVISQIADGSGWKTLITLVNLDSTPAPFTVRFFRADGTALLVPLTVGAPSATVEGIIPVGGTSIIESLGGVSALVQGWAQLTSTRNVGGLAVFRQRAPGRPDQEAAVTLTTTSNRFVLPFDNTTDFTTSMTIVNTTATFGSAIGIVIRDESGLQLGADSITLGGRGYLPFTLTERLPLTRGRRGTVEFNATTQITGLGLRFNDGGAFTSYPVMQKR